MIKLTLPDHSEILINADQIEKIETGEPARVILKQGDIIEVRETAASIIKLIKALSVSDQQTPE